MPIKFIYGKSGTGKTTKCFSHISSLLAENNNSKIIYIVPEQFSLESEKRVVRTFGGGCVSRIDVLSFARLASQVFGAYGPLYKEYINKSGGVMLLRLVILKLQNKFSSLNLAAQQDNFADTMFDLVSELKRYNVTPEALLSIANETNNSELETKLSDIAKIFEDYLSKIQPPIGDPENNLNILCEKIIKHNLFTDTHFIIDEFSDFSPQELAVIKTIMLQGIDVTFSFTTDSLKSLENAIDIFSTTKNSIAQIIDMAIDNNIPVLPSERLDKNFKHADNPELAHLESNYFRYPSLPYQQVTQNISVFTAGNPYKEVECAAREIMRLTRDKGLRFRDIVLLTRDVDTYSLHISSIFPQYDIASFIDDTISTLCYPLTQFILSIPEIFINNWNFNSIFRYIKFGFCDVSPEDIYLFENYVLAAGVTPAQWRNETEFTFIPPGFDEGSLEIVNSVRRKITAPLAALYQKFSKCTQVMHYVDELYAFLEHQEIAQKLECSENIKINAQLWDCVMSVFTQMYELMGDSSVTTEGFYKILNTGLSETTVSQIPQTVDQVLLSSIDRFRGYAPRAILILGSLEGQLPRGYLGQGILSDTDRRTMADQGLRLACDTTSRQFDEYNLIYRLLTAPTEYLSMYLPLADMEGKALAPSPIISRLNAIFPNLTHNSDIYESHNSLDQIEGLIPTFNQVVNSLSLSKKGEQIAPELSVASKWFEENMPDSIETAKTALEYINKPKKISQKAASMIYSTMNHTSISQIEQFSRCQFSFFLKYGLRAAPRREYQIKAPDTGIFIHNIIERFSSYALSLPNGWYDLDPDTCKEKVGEITDIILKESLGEIHLNSPRFSTLSLKLKRIMTTSILNIYNFYKETSFQPLGYEIAFGNSSTYPPIDITLDNGQVIQLIGKVDRADVLLTEQGRLISVVDYKSSQHSVDFSLILGGIQIQLPAYVNAICHALTSSDGIATAPAAMLYYTLSNPIVQLGHNVTSEEIQKAVKAKLKMSGLIISSDDASDAFTSGFAPKSNITSEELAKITSFSFRKIKSAMENILDGAILINPFRHSRRNACEFCPYLSVCRFDVSDGASKYRSLRNIRKEDFINHVDKMDSKSTTGN